MIDYELLARQRETLQRLVDDDALELGREERDAIRGMVNLAGWMIEWKDENRENREIAAMIRGAVAEANGTYDTRLPHSWAGFPILVLTEQERRVIGRALEVTELVGDVIADQLNEPPMHKPTIHALRDKIGVVS